MKNYNLKIRTDAQQDVRNIKDYITDTLNAPEAALNLISKFYEAFLRIKDFPFSGEVLKTAYPLEYEYRKIIVDSYIIFYIVDEEGETINIMRVLYGSSNYISILKN